MSFFFFFSSRRRHTRFDCDWSSDVCSSDLRAPLPKVEVYRLVAGPEPIFDAAAHDPEDWVAMVTDHPRYRAEFPVFRFSDTAWLVTLANLAWDRAKILAP